MVLVPIAGIGLAVIITALMGAIVVYSIILLIQVIVGAVSGGVRQVPIIGPQLADAMQNATQSIAIAVQGIIVPQYAQAAQPVTAMSDAAVYNLRQNFEEQANIIALQTAAIIYIHDNTVTSVAGPTNITISGNVDAATQQLYQDIVQVQNNAIDYTQQVERDLEGYVQGVQTYLQGQIAGAQNAAFASEVTAEQYSDSKLSQAIANMQAQVAADITGVDTALGATAQALSTDIDQTRSQLQGTLTAVQGWAQGEFNRQTLQEAADIAGVTAIITTVVQPAVAAIEDTLTNCLEPMCEAGPNFFRGFQDIANLLSIGALIALLVEAVRDPTGTAQAVAGDAEALVGVPEDILKTLFGV